MIITQRIETSRIIAAIWRNFLLLVLFCISWYQVDIFILKDLIQFPAFIQAFQGSALTFLIVFTNNQDYDRWWEARKIWDSLVKGSRSWTRHIMYYSTSDDLEGKRKIEEVNIGIIHHAIRLIKTQHQK